MDLGHGCRAVAAAGGADVTDDREAVEAMARAMFPRAWREDDVLPQLQKDYRGYATAALAAYRAHQTARGVVEVPREPPKDQETQEKIWLAAQLQNANAQYRAMLAAAETKP